VTKTNSLFSVCLQLTFQFEKRVSRLDQSSENKVNTKHTRLYFLSRTINISKQNTLRNGHAGLSIGTMIGPVHCLQKCFVACLIFFECAVWCMLSILCGLRYGAGHSTGLIVIFNLQFPGLVLYSSKNLAAVL
jgi:hypothetical protein